MLTECEIVVIEKNTDGKEVACWEDVVCFWAHWEFVCDIISFFRF